MTGRRGKEASLVDAHGESLGAVPLLVAEAEKEVAAVQSPVAPGEIPFS